jgi:DnaJ family protein C protein 13
MTTWNFKEFFSIISGTDIQCIGHFRLLFSLLRLESCPKMQGMALLVLSHVTASSECIDDIAANQVTKQFFLAQQK